MSNPNQMDRQAILYSDVQPTPEQEKRFADFLRRRYGEEVPVRWEKDPSCTAASGCRWTSTCRSARTSTTGALKGACASSRTTFRD